MKTCPQCGTSYESAATFCARDGEVLEETAASEEMVGRVLDGQYEIESFIARGGMGTLYRARHILLGDRVAIKTLKPEMRGNTEWLRRFQREGRAARRFRHPNAVTVYDLRTSADGLTYMVMEYVEGHSLDQELKRRVRLSPAEAWEILAPVVGALEAAHAQGVVHRDLKPENVMLNRTPEGELGVKLLDLGIAKLRDVAETRAGDGGALTLAGQILGTPYYMSPEQWGEPSRDGRAEIDGRADIYSLGVIFYELITGAKPFAGQTLGELRQGHVSRRLPLLHGVVEGVPEEFARAVERAMAKDRADRPATAGVFAEEMRAALGFAPAMRRTPDADADEGDTTAAVLPDFELSQTLIRENVSEATLASPDASVETATQVPTASQRAAATTSATAEPQADARAPDQTPRQQALPQTPHQMPEPSPRQTQQTPQTTTQSPQQTTPKSPPQSRQSQQLQQQTSPQSRQQTPPASQAHSVAQTVARRSPFKLIAVGAVALVLACAVVAGVWLAWNSREARRASGVERAPGAAGSGAVAPPARFELMDYWIEVFDTAGERGEGRRVASRELRLPTGQQFKFHFVARERGYLYIVGPGAGNAPTTFLTARPAGIMKTNLAPAGADFAFPYGDGQVLELDENPGTEEYVIIFSRAPLLAPAFLATEAGHELTPVELKELEDLRARAKTALPVGDVKDADAKGGAVTVAVQSTGAPTEPVIFDIRIEHR